MNTAALRPILRLLDRVGFSLGRIRLLVNFADASLSVLRMGHRLLWFYIYRMFGVRLGTLSWLWGAIRFPQLAFILPRHVFITTRRI